MSKLPKVKFKLPTIKREAEVMMFFCKPKKGRWDWSKIIYKNHPELREILKDKKSDEYYKYVHKYSSSFIKKNRKKIEKLVKEYQIQWDKINDSYLKVLSEHFETDYPADRKIITAYVSIVPIYPRFLDRWSFNVTYKNIDFAIRISMHEIVHFLYFKKWMEVFPKTKKEELNSPHLIWRLSEILDPIIINHNKDIQKIFKSKHWHYYEFQKVKIGKKTMIEYFENLYKKHLKSGKSFEEFLKISWSETKKHKKIIGNI
jgi:hypothetical protein